MTSELLTRARDHIYIAWVFNEMFKALPALHAASEPGGSGVVLCALQQYWDACDGAATAAMPSTLDSTDAL